MLWQARTCDRAAREGRREALAIECMERAKLRAGVVPGIRCMSWVKNMKRKSALEQCRKELKTRPISDKSKELASSAVTNALRTALEREFDALGIDSVKLVLKERIEKGKVKYRLVLDLPTTSKLSDILSEGEQRAIAIGSFLAELSLAGHSGGIVFDDPVSSLDHWRRRHVAARLVAESGHRQVVVFTHDTSFLGQLREEIERCVASRTLSTRWSGRVVKQVSSEGDCPGNIRATWSALTHSKGTTSAARGFLGHSIRMRRRLRRWLCRQPNARDDRARHPRLGLLRCHCQVQGLGSRGPTRWRGGI